MSDGIFALDDRGVVVTGGGGHLGRAITLALARAGAFVVAMGRTSGSLESVVEMSDCLAGRVVPCLGDVSRSDDIQKAMDLIKSSEKRLCGWINNAFEDTASALGDLERNAVELSVSSGLIDPMMIIDQVVAEMHNHGRGGSIVNIASMYGLVSPDPTAYATSPHYHNPPAYGAAKAGLIQHTRYAAVHLAKQGIRVNAISPGPFPGPAVQQDKAFIEALASRTPMGRIGEPDELAGAVVFLISDASSYMTGQNLIVDGGWTAW